jgi:hypothetical protein
MLTVKIKNYRWLIAALFFTTTINYLDRQKAAGNLAGGYRLIFTLCRFTYLIAGLLFIY